MPAAQLDAAGRGDQRAAAATATARGPGCGSATARTSTCSATSPGWSRSGIRPKPEPTAIPTRQLKERARARNVALSLAGRDIGELPAVVNPERKAQAASDFRFFCEAYFPLTFHLAWSPDHLKVIAKIEQAVLRGGLFAMAMPRGSGKTTICECACIWAVLYGHREFVCLIGSDEGHADGHARIDQDGTGRQRPAAGGLPRGRVPDPVPGRDRQPLQRPALPGRADPHRLDGQRDRAADDARQPGASRRHHQGGRASPAASAA